MAVFTIGRLTLEYRTQSQKKWIMQEYGTLVYQARPAALRIDHVGSHCLMAKALDQALPLMVTPEQGQEGHRPTVDELLKGWRGIFKDGADRKVMASMVRTVLERDFNRMLETLLGKQVTTISAAIPYHWRLVLLWDPPLGLAPELEWMFDFKPCYMARLTQAPQFE